MVSREAQFERTEVHAAGRIPSASMTHPYSEAETRQEIIDKRLALAGWDLNDPSQVTEELDIDLTKGQPKRVRDPKSHYAGHQFVDYALLRRGKPIAVVEAKKTSKDAQLGQEQALQYAQNLQKANGGPMPFVSYTKAASINNLYILWVRLTFKGVKDLRALREKVAQLWPHLDERARRLFAASEARALRHGGVSLVSRA